MEWRYLGVHRRRGDVKKKLCEEERKCEKRLRGKSRGKRMDKAK